jgi:hypothetical protein
MIEPRNTREEAQRLITEAMGEIEDRKRVRAQIEESASPALTRDRAAGIGLTVAVPVLIAIVGINFAGDTLRSWFEPRPSSSAVREEAQKSLDSIVRDIEAFREDYNELPESLVEAGMPSRGQWKYQVLDQRHYRIEGRLHGQVVSFDSTRATARAVDRRP